jgi:hypothetical protein
MVAMDRQRAAAVLSEQLVHFRALTYENLRNLIGSLEAFEVVNPSGENYQVEIQVLWDGKPSDGNIRVMGAIDDGGLLSAFSPLCEDFMMTPDGAVR